MLIHSFRFLSVLILGGVALVACGGVNNPVKTISAQPNADGIAASKPASSPTPQAAAKGEQNAVFAGGCFWGVEAVFEHVKGVSDVTSGFSYARATMADNDMVKETKNRYAEAVKVTYDPSKITYEQLLKIFFLVAHDPTELNRQGPDVGTEYRSAIFYASDEQKRLAENYVAELTKAKTFARPIVTQIIALDKFNQAGDDHQDYMAKHPDDAYIVINDKPKLENLRKQFPDLYVSK
ncbi:MAG TPA: peptide-methionine (S)-S-oxide reductase MsrA [Pyrinomonadaceae bacterium]|jgi:peptide-methionine (S)-S-oxide reductase